MKALMFHVMHGLTSANLLTAIERVSTRALARSAKNTPILSVW